MSAYLPHLLRYTDVHEYVNSVYSWSCACRPQISMQIFFGQENTVNRFSEFRYRNDNCPLPRPSPNSLDRISSFQSASLYLTQSGLNEEDRAHQWRPRNGAGAAFPGHGATPGAGTVDPGALANAAGDRASSAATDGHLLTAKRHRKANPSPDPIRPRCNLKLAPADAGGAGPTLGAEVEVEPNQQQCTISRALHPAQLTAELGWAVFWSALWKRGRC